MSVITLCFSVILAVNPLFAEDITSSRELCRKELAGKYLSIYNSLQRNSEFVGLLTQKLNLYRKEATEVEKKYRDLSKKSEQEAYNVTLQRSVTASKNRWQYISQKIEDVLTQLERAKQEQKDATYQEKTLREHMDLSFRIDHNQQTKFPITIRYKDPCPKYRFTCPLTRNQARKLKELPVEIPACLQYAKFSLGMGGY